MKKVVVILLCALLLCGCQSQTGNDQSGAQPSESSAVISSTTQSETAADTDTSSSENSTENNSENSSESKNESSSESKTESSTESKTESSTTEESNSSGGENMQKQLGGLTPEEALEYMKTTENLVIVEVNTAEWKKKVGFIGAMWIPHDEMAERYDEIPTDRPVLLHCGGGIVSVPAYETLIEKRPDIPELGYIAGAPKIEEYNKWIEEG